MEYIRFSFGSLIFVVFFIVITRIFMMIAAHIGGTFGFGEFFLSLFKKSKKNK